TFVIVGIVAVGLASLVWDTLHAEHPNWQIVAWTALVVVVYRLIATPYRLYASERGRREALEHAMVPHFETGDPDFAATQLAGSARAVYLRVPVRNMGSSTATRCAARLIGIEHLGQNGFRPLAYNDQLDMAWSNKGDREIDIPPGA